MSYTLGLGDRQVRVYKFERGNLRWRQRRSYSFIAKPAKPKWIENN